MFNYRRIYTLKITQSCSGESDQQMGCIAYTVCELAYMMISANTLKRLRNQDHQVISITGPRTVLIKIQMQPVYC